MFLYSTSQLIMVFTCAPTPVLLPGKSHGWRNLVGCSPWGREELDMTERLHFHFSLSCIGEGNGNPLQCSCLENLRDGGAWWAAVYGVAQSRTHLKWLGSSSRVCIAQLPFYCDVRYCFRFGPCQSLSCTQLLGTCLYARSRADWWGYQEKQAVILAIDVSPAWDMVRRDCA